MSTCQATTVACDRPVCSPSASLCCRHLGLIASGAKSAKDGEARAAAELAKARRNKGGLP